MKRTAVFLSGLAATLTGVVIRTCNSGVEFDLASAWCGKAPPSVTNLASHAHCAGCAVALFGLVAMGLATASLFIQRNVKRADVQVRR